MEDIKMKRNKLRAKSRKMNRAIYELSGSNQIFEEIQEFIGCYESKFGYSRETVCKVLFDLSLALSWRRHDDAQFQKTEDTLKFHAWAKEYFINELALLPSERAVAHYEKNCELSEKDPLEATGYIGHISKSEKPIH